MSTHIICDSCRCVIYQTKGAVSWDFQIAHWDTTKKESLQHLCKGCAMKVAMALLPLLPDLAGYIEPDVFQHEREVDGRGSITTAYLTHDEGV